MAKRVSISSIMHRTGLSRATVDRALNARGGVHPQTEKLVKDAVESLQVDGGTHTQPQANQKPVDLVARLGRGLAAQLDTVARDLKLPARFIDMQQKSEADIYDQVAVCCEKPDRPLILAAKRDERLHALLIAARNKGKRIVTVVSDLPQETRDGFVGIDNRAAGQTAALLIGNALRERKEARVGVVLGDAAFNCHEDREIGFRSHLRAHFPNIRLLDAVKGEDSPEQTYTAVKSLLDEGNIAAIYNVAGGNMGLASAIRDKNSRNVIVVTHEANMITAPLLQDDVIKYVLAQSPIDLLRASLRMANLPQAPAGYPAYLVDFGVYTKFNLPRFRTTEL